MSSGRKAVFDNEADKSMAHMENTNSAYELEQKKPDDEKEFNLTKFESMFQKQMQILDTDYDTYAVVYTCQDNAEWEGKSEAEIT